MIGQSDIASQRQSLAASLPKLELSFDDLIAQVAPGLLADRDKILAAEAEKKRRAEEKAGIDDARRKAAARDITGMTGAQREILRARVLRWEVENEWEPLAFVAQEQIEVCLCGSKTPHIIGIYQHQQLRAKHQTKRFVRWAPEEAAGSQLPRSVLQIEHPVMVCSHCAMDNGFVGSAEHADIIEDLVPKRQDDKDTTIRNLRIEVREMAKQIRLQEQEERLLRAEVMDRQRLLDATMRNFKSARRYIRKALFPNWSEK